MWSTASAQRDLQKQTVTIIGRLRTTADVLGASLINYRVCLTSTRITLPRHTQAQGRAPRQFRVFDFSMYLLFIFSNSITECSIRHDVEICVYAYADKYLNVHQWVLGWLK